MKKNNKLIVGLTTLVVLSGGIYTIYDFNQKDNQHHSKEVSKNLTSTKKTKRTKKAGDIVVSEILEKGYVTIHGDHTHFISGIVPYNAKILDSLVLKDSHYIFNANDVLYELAQGYVIKYLDKIYYYPKENITQTNIVSMEEAKVISTNAAHNSHEEEHTYIFDPKDIVSETSDAFIVRHGDHFHYIKKSDLSSNQISAGRNHISSITSDAATNHSTDNSYDRKVAGFDYPDSDGYLFKGESDIVERTSVGLVLRHGDHTHFVFNASLQGTKWEYLITSTSNIEHNKNNNIISITKPTDKKENTNHNKENTSHHKDNANSTIIDIVKPADKIKFAGIDFETSDGFLFNGEHIENTLSNMFLVKHGKHTHPIYYYELVHSKWEALIPKEHLQKAKEDYTKFENEIKDKINYLSKTEHITPSQIKLVDTKKGKALEYTKNNIKQSILLKDIKITENTSVYTNEEKEKIKALAKELNISENDIWIVDTPKGKALRYWHGDHTHDVLMSEIETENTTVNEKEIEDKINYIVDVYGVLKESIKINNGLFIFNDPSHDGYDATHIHPYIIPIDKLIIPTITGNAELDFEAELLSLAKRNNIAPSAIKIINNKFAIPHGDHDHFVKIKAIEGKDLYFKNKLPSIIGEYISGQLNKEDIKEKISELIHSTKEKYTNINEARRIIRELEALNDEVENKPTNSTNGYKKMLDKFANQYIFKTDTSEDENKEIIEKYNEALNSINKISDKVFNNFKINKDNLIEALHNNSKDLKQIEAINHFAKEIKKFNGRFADFKYNYTNYFLENIHSNKISNELREELAFLILNSTEDKKITLPLVPRFIEAKNNLYKELNDNIDYEITNGENYTNLKSDENIINNIKNVVNSYKKYFDKLEFAENIKKENPEEVLLKKKIEHIANSLGIDKDSITITKENDKTIITYPHDDHNHSVYASDVDLEKEFKVPHSHTLNTPENSKGVQVLRQLGLNDELIYILANAEVADTYFPKDEENETVIKDWLKTVKKLNFKKIDKPLEKINFSLLPNLEILSLGDVEVSHTEVLANLTNLKELYIPNANLENLNFLENLQNLEALDLSGNKISNLSFIANLPNLKMLALENNHISNISELNKATNLEALYLASNDIEDISPLANLEHLVELSLKDNYITDVSILNDKNIAMLDLSNNENLEINSLTSDSLEELIVDNANLYNLSFIRNLPNIASLSVKNNNISEIKYLDTASNLLALSMDNNKLTSLEGIQNSTSIKFLNVTNNKITSLNINGQQGSIIGLEVDKNNLTSLEGINQFTIIKTLNANNNFIKTLDISTPNTSLGMLEVANNNISNNELLVENDIPIGVSKNFPKVTKGNLANNYALTKENVIAKIDEFSNLVDTYEKNNQLNHQIADELLKQVRLIKLDIKYATKVDDEKLIAIIKDLEALKDTLSVILNEIPHHTTTDDTHHFEFNINDIIDGNELGYNVRHDDHTHFVYKKDLTTEQIRQAEEFLKTKTILTDKNEIAVLSEEEINQKINYIALFYGINTNDIQKEDDNIRFTYKNEEKVLSLHHITVPLMSDDLEGDFEKELNALAKQMQTSPASISVADGILTVPHGNHTHSYPAKSPGWRTYLDNKMPTIELPIYEGTLDRDLIHNKLTQLNNKVNKELRDQPSKLRQANQWIKDIRDVSLPYSVTSTKGYLEAIQKFEDLYFTTKKAETNNNHTDNHLNTEENKYDQLRNEIRQLDDNNTALLIKKIHLLNQLDNAQANQDDTLFEAIKRELENINQTTLPNPQIEKYNNLVQYLEANKENSKLSETTKNLINEKISNIKEHQLTNEEKIALINDLENIKSKIKEDFTTYEEKDSRYAALITNLLSKTKESINAITDENIKNHLTNELNKLTEALKISTDKESLHKEVAAFSHTVNAALDKKTNENSIVDTTSHNDNVDDTQINAEINTIISYINSNRRNISDDNIKLKQSLLNRLDNLEIAFNNASKAKNEILSELKSLKTEVENNLKPNTSANNDWKNGW